MNLDVKAAHSDVHALLDAGVLRGTDDGLAVFPFDAIHVDVTLHAAERAALPEEPHNLVMILKGEPVPHPRAVKE